MGLNYVENPIYGSHGPIITTPPTLQVARAKYMGVRGSSQVIGESGLRPLYCESWIHNSYVSAADLIAYLKTLDTMVGFHGALEQTGPYERVWQECTFEGFEMDPLGPLLDQAKSIDSGVAGWWCKGVLRWTQLTVWDD